MQTTESTRGQTSCKKECDLFLKGLVFLAELFFNKIA